MGTRAEDHRLCCAAAHRPTVEAAWRWSAMTINDETYDSELRHKAIRRLKKRRDFGQHLVVYVVVNGFLVAIWAITGLHGFFWPVFPILGWGIGLVLNAWDVYRPEGFTEDEIRKEERHLQDAR
jgi:hypothetical protein